MKWYRFADEEKPPLRGGFLRFSEFAAHWTKVTGY